MTREEKILAFMQSEHYIPMRADELAVVLDVPAADAEIFYAMLSGLIKDGKIIENKKRRLKYNETKKITGKFSALRSGGFVDALDGTVSLFVPLTYTNGAIDGDIVTCMLRKTKKKKPDDKDEGEILEILRHTLTHVVGTLTYYGRAVYLEPDNAALGFSIRITDTLGAQHGEKCVAKIEKYPRASAYAEGIVTQLLGKDGSIDAELSAISHKAGLRTAFDADVLAQAEQAEQEPILPDGRTDFRTKKVITIDGDDAKDFDDAVCIEKTSDGYILYVHIADVTHYVKQGSPLDTEAYRRGTSVYYPGRVLPMLPEALSNGICSLKEGEDRYTLSVTMHVDRSGNVTDYKIENGIIRSMHRMTYRIVTDILDNEDSVYRAQYADITDELFEMQKLAQILTQKRLTRGSIEFNIPEPHILLGEDGFPTAIGAHEAGVSNKIIEEFMLLTNETVARYAFDCNLPFIYRVHETPSADKMENLNAFLGFMGLPVVKPKGDVMPKDFAAIITAAQAEDNPGLICTATLRAMMKARYADENLGHFGLAAQYYCHFTSPIRRYPDLFIHRVLKAQLDDKPTENILAQSAAAAKAAAENATETEIAAVDAEREADKYFMCLYMKQFVGCEFTAVISSVTDFGIFVTLNDAIDGMISFSHLEDDYYKYVPAHYCLRGERTGKTYMLGDTLQVKLVHVSVHDRKIDFAPLGIFKREKKPYDKILETKKKKAKKSNKQKGKTQKFLRKKR